MKKIISIILLALLAAPALFSQDGVTSSSELFFQISSLPEAKIGYTHNFLFPVLQGDDPLTSGNNLTLGLTAEITPISLNGIFQAELTPVAFLKFAAGVRLGAGWHINLFGSDIYGTGFNSIDSGGNESYRGGAFDALMWKTYIGGTFQFDLAAVIPGDWNHVVMQTYHEINYHANTKAQNGEAWYFESDDGENRNGFNYSGNLVIGYQMPIFLNMVAFMAEMDLYLYDNVQSESGKNRESWGDDLIRWKFSNILNFQVSNQFSIAVITQFKTRRNFTNYVYNKDDTQRMHYQERILNTSDPMSLEFYRVAAIFNLKL